MIENRLRFFFRNQIWHLGGTIILFYVGAQLVDLDSNTNTFLGISGSFFGEMSGLVMLSWSLVTIKSPIKPC